MEVEGAAYLQTLAGVMITFAGFSALLLTVRQAAGARSSILDRYLARMVMTYIFVLTAAALLPLLLALYGVPEKWIWQASAMAFAPAMFVLQVTYPYRRRKAIGVWPPPSILAVQVALGAAATSTMFCYVMAGLPHSAAAYITALTIDFFTVTFAFVVALDVIMRQPIEKSER